MGIFDRFRKKPVKPAEPRSEKSKKSEKDLATERGEPWVNVVKIELDPNSLHEGSIELDWNEIFIARLVKAGYMMKPTDTDKDIVDRWYLNVCRHIVMETWEQEQAMNPTRYTRERDLGDGRKEIS